MENVLDHAHHLARAIKNSQEFQAFKKARKQMESNEKTFEMVKDFEKRQIDMQTRRLSGEEISKEEEDKLTELYTALMKDHIAADYMAKQLSFGLMMQDISKILSEATVLE